MGALVTREELERAIREWQENNAKSPRTYPPAVLAHTIIKLVETRRELAERNKVRGE